MSTAAASRKGVPTTTTNPPAAQQQSVPLSPTPADDRPLIYVNGKMLPKSQATVSCYDHGLLYGDGVFEGIRVYKGKIFKCKQHIERLWKSADGIRLKIPVSREEMVKIQRRCIEANEISDGYIRLVVTRGYGELGLDPRKCPTPGIICIADQIHLFPPELYEKGMRVIVAHRPKTPIACLDPRVKSLNYLNNILAKVEAIDFGCHEVIMLNTEGFVTEGSGDNLFVVKGGKLFTPPPEAGLLEGITREFVIKTLAKDCKLKVIQSNMRLADVLSADEVFLTGSAAEIIAVTQIDEHDKGKIIRENRISDGEGPITKRLRARFREIVTSDHVPEE
jgi:branched-chain amino acid aminotransferase